MDLTEKTENSKRRPWGVQKTIFLRGLSVLAIGGKNGGDDGIV
jgi:hypothetical protein